MHASYCCWSVVPGGGGCYDFSTLQSAKDFASNSRLKEVMGKAEVKGVPEIWFVNQAN
jgi:hypothetical protein